MYNVKLPGSKYFDSHIPMHYCTQNNDVGLVEQFQKHLSMDYCKHGVIDQVIYSKRASKRKCTDRDYHVQDNSNVAHKDVKMYCDTN